MSRFVRLGSLFAWLFAAGFCSVIIAICAFYLYLTPKLPDPISLKTTQLQTPLRIFSADNKKIAEFGEKRRNPITYNEAPETLVNAFIAAEDNRFFSHQGIDIKGLTRAATQLIQSGRIKSGGSTITMQVAKNFFLTREKTFIRKFNEIFLALQIEQVLNKEEIFELYMNKIYLGNRAYGVRAAASVYYGKPLNELELAELAMIAGLPKAPSRYNPIVNPERAIIRRNWILDRMLDLSMISEAAHTTAKNARLTASYHGHMPEVDAPYVAEAARQKILELYGSEAYTDGLVAFLTIDSEKQNSAQKALRNGLEAYDRRHGYRPVLGNIENLVSLDENEIQRQLKTFPRSVDHINAAIREVNVTTLKAHTRDYGIIELKLEDAQWAKPFVTINSIGKAPKSFDKMFQIGDIIELRRTEEAPEPVDVTASASNDQLAGGADTQSTENPPNIRWVLSQTPEVQGALISLAPKNGAIQALVGGYDFYSSKYNRATQAKRQPGSSFKPFIYLAAIENNTTAASLINDAPMVFEDKNLETSWRPENSSGKFYGPTRVRQAFYNSRNLVSIRLLKNTGITKTIESNERFGFDRNTLPKNLSLALGSAAVAPFKIASGYAMIANGGYYVAPYLIERIENASGQIIYQAEPYQVCEDGCLNELKSGSETASFKVAPRIADERSIYIMHSLMKDVIKKGTGRKALTLRRNDIGGKTGTTNDQRDAWFSGFNQALATTVWVGFDTPSTLGRREYGSRAALPIWIEYMRGALKGIPNAEMPQPKGLVTVRIDSASGKRANIQTTDSMFEIFKAENAPKTDRQPIYMQSAEDDQYADADDIF